MPGRVLPKRLLLGRAVRSDRLGETLLPKRIALPVFASDPLSSVAYATQEVLVVLTLGGTAYLMLTPFLAGAVFLLLVVVVASYRQLVHAYPSGGGDYEVATTNLGRPAGMVVASALLTDYVLTVAVSVSAGVDNVISAFEGLNEHRVLLAVLAVVLLTSINLRGVKESGRVFAVPTYAFVVGVLAMVAVGLGRTAFGDTPVAESAAYQIDSETGVLTGLALVLFVLRAFSSGCTALTGVEAIANGVPAFQEPKSSNAAKTLVIMGVLAMSMFLGITALAVLTQVRYVEPDNLCGAVTGFGGDCTTDAQRTVIAQVSAAVFGDGSVPFFALQAATAAVLVLAANTAFNGFPLLGSILARDRLLPRQLHTRGDRLVHSNGILLLAGFATLLIVVFAADVTRLIQLYILGVFTSFTFGQAGLVRHWNRALATEEDAQRRRRIRRSRAINATGASLTGLVLLIVTVTKFTHGAWIVIVAMPFIYLGMRGIATHYETVAAELDAAEVPDTLPSRNHVLVLVSKIHAPTLRAISYARALRPSSLAALTVAVDASEARALQEEWDARDLPVPLVVLDSPYREITRPVLEHVRRVRRQSPRDVVTVVIPEYVVGRWWEQLLHNQSALRLKTRLLFQPGVAVTSVPYQLHSSDRLARDEDDRASSAPGGVRQGLGSGSGSAAAPAGPWPGAPDSSARGHVPGDPPEAGTAAPAEDGR